MKQISKKHLPIIVSENPEHVTFASLSGVNREILRTAKRQNCQFWKVVSKVWASPGSNNNYFDLGTAYRINPDCFMQEAIGETPATTEGLGYREGPHCEIMANEPATIVFWDDGTKTIVKRCKGDKNDPVKAFLVAHFIKSTGLSRTQAGKYLDDVKSIAAEK